MMGQAALRAGLGEPARWERRVYMMRLPRAAPEGRGRLRSATAPRSPRQNSGRAGGRALPLIIQKELQRRMAALGRPGEIANNTSEFAPLSWRAAGRVRSVARRAGDSSKRGQGTYEAGLASLQEEIGEPTR